MPKLAKNGNWRKKYRQYALNKTSHTQKPKKLIDSRAPTIGVSYAVAATQKAAQKTYRTVDTLTNFPAKNTTELQKTNLNKASAKPTQSTKMSQPHSSKLPLHRRSQQNIISLHPEKQNRISARKKNLPSVKSSITNTNPLLTRKKKDLPTSKKDNSLQDEAFLTLHPSDSTKNEDNKSTISNNSSPDLYI